MAGYTRRKLEEMIDVYLAALAINDHSRLPVTRDVRVSENYQPLKLGEGIWRTITGIGTYKHYFADSETGTAGFIGTVRENGTGALLDIRLQLDGDLISEIETFIIRDALASTRYERELGKPEGVWLEAVPPEKRLSRPAMIAAVDKYFQGMENNDGKGDYSFFDPECNRIEHALQTTNVKTKQAYGHSTDTDFSSMTAEAQWKTGFLGFVTAIRDRRFVVLDEERQAVLTIVTLDHNGTIRQIPLTTGKTFVIPPYFDVPRTLNVIEAFKLRGDKLYRIEMTLTELPYGTRPPSAAAPIKPARREPTYETPEALNARAAAVLAGMKAHSATGLPLARDVSYTENGQELKIGDGLWGTLTDFAESGAAPARATPQYRVATHDSLTNDAVIVCGIMEESTPGMLALRVRSNGERITEIEAVVFRHEEVGERGGTVTLFQPRLIAEFDPKAFAETDPAYLEIVKKSRRSSYAELKDAVDGYFDGLENNTSRQIKMTEDVTRRDNGMIATNNSAAPPLDPENPAYKPFAHPLAYQINTGYFRRISKLRERRHLVDETHALVVSFAIADNPGRAKGFTVPGIPGLVKYPGGPAGQAAVPVQGSDQLFGTRRGVNAIVPTSELTVQLSKIIDGKIVHIETLSRGVPYGMTSGSPAQEQED